MIINDSSYKDPQALRSDGSVEADEINFVDESTISGISGGNIAASTALIEILTERLNKAVYYNTTANWNAQTSLVSELKSIYIYSDYKLVNGEYIPGIKIGDGDAYVVDLPFIDADLTQHIADAAIHVSAADRLNWNNKVRCIIDETDTELLIFTTN